MGNASTARYRAMQKVVGLSPIIRFP